MKHSLKVQVLTGMGWVDEVVSADTIEDIALGIESIADDDCEEMLLISACCTEAANAADFQEAAP